jgi:hypothetical protein
MLLGLRSCIIAALPSPSILNDSSLSIPQARTGSIRHPKGSAPVKALPDGKSANLLNLQRDPGSHPR